MYTQALRPGLSTGHQGLQVRGASGDWRSGALNGNRTFTLPTEEDAEPDRQRARWGQVSPTRRRLALEEARGLGEGAGFGAQPF